LITPSTSQIIKLLIWAKSLNGAEMKSYIWTISTSS